MSNAAPNDAQSADVRDAAETLHSLNAGLVIHRVGDVHQELFDEARAFSIDLTRYMNDRIGGRILTRLYEEGPAGSRRLHWLVHMKSPTDYRLLLDMVDHDKDFQAIYEGDRLPERGGGNWEKMFRQGSFHEVTLLPQHGFAHEAMDALDRASFVPPARHQIPGDAAAMLHSGNAGALLLRTFAARYESRDLARFYLSQWQAAFNRAAAGRATAGQYEQIWGYQDRLGLIVALRAQGDHPLVAQIERTDPDLRAVMAKLRVDLRGEARDWTGLFEPGAPTDELLVPVAS
jgi:hypothetical protein